MIPKSSFDPFLVTIAFTLQWKCLLHTATGPTSTSSCTSYCFSISELHKHGNVHRPPLHVLADASLFLNFNLHISKCYEDGSIQRPPVITLAEIALLVNFTKV
jgi:hypothetical protein